MDLHRFLCFYLNFTTFAYAQFAGFEVIGLRGGEVKSPNGFGIPLLAVPTLEVMCVPVLLKHDDLPENALLCPMLDARRMEVYAALYDRALKPVREVQADVVDADTYREWLDQRPIYFFGNGAKKCMDIINHPNAHYIDGIEPLAKNMFPLAERKMMRGETEDVAYFSPFYLKDFVALKPKKLL